ncbi:glycosyltransferase family 2 protein [Shewanella salipaludis]|uniref:Glycosyltransferase family 2 protein n=1 Tax=Shewanella salipaludis TaxID=2723052 RepID=A0A972JKY4_9GAMM|nr:glycosyltransferase family 2 protein [Shewanella salipaludis]NMH64852.1 glycosyltransferase family 2 protein [Shewanella salipaludis]
MKLIVQIPCYNEAANLTSVIEAIPRRIPGIDSIETLVIDDGSTDGTAEVARKAGVQHIIVNTGNKGLARSFHTGIETCLHLGADIIVNTDGDNQYCGEDIARLVQPVLGGRADIVVGDRGGYRNPHFSFFKRSLQVLGSFIIRKALALDIADAVSGFRAISRTAAQQLNIVSDFSYTIEMLVQASAKRLSVQSVPIRTNGKLRASRLFRNIPQFLYLSCSTLVRIYTMYRPLRVFFSLGLLAVIIGGVPIIRFLYFYFQGMGDGHVQSLILGGTLLVLGFIILLIGLVADLINFNRKLMEKMLYRMEKLEQMLADTRADGYVLISGSNEINNKSSKDLDVLKQQGPPECRVAATDTNTDTQTEANLR